MTPTFTKPVRVKYLQNTYLLQEIHRSKITFSYYVDPRYQDYDMILDSFEAITPELAEQAIAIRADRETKQAREDARQQGMRRNTQAWHALTKQASDYTISDVTFRVMTHDHVPLQPGKKKNPKTVADLHITTNFPPYKHYAYNDAGELREVGRSHWVGDLENGHFSQDHGKISNGLGRAFQMLVEKYGQRGNFRGYSYIEDMKCEALCVLSAGALKFNEARSDNPFSYYTMATNNAFLKILNAEKKQQNIRDDELERAGQAPSMARQLRNEGR